MCNAGQQFHTALVAAMIAHHGAKPNRNPAARCERQLARKATGGDRDVARDILGGICDVGLANSYYVGHMKNAKEGTDARKWGDAIKVVQPTFENRWHTRSISAVQLLHATHQHKDRREIDGIPGSRTSSADSCTGELRISGSCKGASRWTQPMAARLVK